MNDRRYAWLEWTTAVVLFLVLLALGWMVLAAYRPQWAEVVGLTAQVVVVLALVSAALLLVSALALLHSRRPEGDGYTGLP